MRRLGTLSVLLTATLVAAQEPEKPARLDALDQWPQWRGPLATGTAPRAKPPTSWSEKKNIRWRVKTPGQSHSSPIVWGDRVIITTAIPFGDKVDPVPDDMPGAHDNAPLVRHQEFAAFAFSRQTGKQLWKASLRKYLPPAGAHKSGSLASASPATDGERIYAFFGSSGLFCLDMAGKPLWNKDLGDMKIKHGHGEGASPALHRNRIAVNWDHEGQSFVAVFDTKTGDEVWKQKRDEVTSWASPIVHIVAGKPQLLVAGTKAARGYDLETGKVIWEAKGLSNNVVASPVAQDGIAVFGSSYVRRAMFALDLNGAKGDLTPTKNVLWRRQHRTPYVPSPLLFGKWVYFLNHYQGVLTRVEVKTGKEPLGPFRLNGVWELYASPVGADGKIYFADRDGATLVIAHGDGEPKLLAANKLDDEFNASIAVAGSDLILKGVKHIYCVAETK